ncbi:MAG: MAPEG family protein [Alphaproteobacteria bacterium]
MAIGMALGVILTLIIFWLLWDRIGITPRQISLNERLSYAAKWCLVPGASLLLGIMMLANHRFFTRGIDRLSGSEDRTTQIWLRYIRNTLEQSVLFVIGILAFAPITYQYWLKAIPILAVLFGTGRALFIIGYFIKPTYRAAGFAMTFYPIIGLYGLCIYFYWLA